MTVHIGEGECAYIQMLYFEYIGYRNLVISMSSIEGFGYAPGRYEEIMRLYQEAYALYNIAIGEIKEKYFKEYPADALIEIDFARYTASIEECCEKGGRGQ